LALNPYFLSTINHAAGDGRAMSNKRIACADTVCDSPRIREE